MKEELEYILSKLVETDSWDLAEDILIGLKHMGEVEERYYKSIFEFLKIATRLTKDTVHKDNLKEALLKLEYMRNKEALEREGENASILLNQLT